MRERRRRSERKRSGNNLLRNQAKEGLVQVGDNEGLNGVLHSGIQPEEKAKEKRAVEVINLS